MSAPKYTFDPEMITKTFRRVVGDANITEVRCLNATTARGGWPRTYSGYFDNAEDLVQALGQIKQASGIYFVPNQVDPSLLARAKNRLRPTPKGESTADSNIVRRRWLLVDCDAQRASGVSASEAEHKAAIERAHSIGEWLNEQGWPEPVVADSGNGGHLLYRIDLTSDDGGLVSRCLQTLTERFSDDAVKVDTSVSNPARIWKLYGTLACKGDSTDDRPHRMSKILYAPDDVEIVSHALLDSLAAEVDETLTNSWSASRSGDSFDIDGFIERNELQVRGPSPWKDGGRKWTLEVSPMCEHHDDGPYIVQLPNGAIAAGCHHDSCDWNWRDLRWELEPDRSNSDRSVATAGAETLRFKAFPVGSLPNPIRKFVSEGSKAIGCDTSYIALPLLSVLAASIGNTRKLKLKEGWEVPSILWTAIVGESGSSKTPAFSLVMEALKELQRQAFEQHRLDLDQYEGTKMFYEKTLADWRRDKNAAGDLPQEPERPTAIRYYVNDTTLEALAPILEANPRGLLVSHDELSGWLGSFDKYAKGKGGSDASQWLSMFNGGSITVDRKTGDPPTIFIPSASVSVAGGIQPGILGRALSSEHRESGLAARILMAMPPRKVKQWTEEEITPELKAEVAELVSALQNLQCEEDEQGRPKAIVSKLTPDAQEVWKNYYNRHAEEQAELTGDLAAAWSKLEEYAARLALVIHHVRSAAGDRTPPDAKLVDVESVEAGIALTQWFKGEARRVYAMFSESEQDRNRRSLLEWIERKGGVTSVRAIQQGHRRFATAAEAEAALNELEELNHGYWRAVPSGPQGGRPSKEFQLYTTSTSTEPAELPDSHGFVDVDETIDSQALISNFNPIIGNDVDQSTGSLPTGWPSMLE